jgi:hypothetical protein
MDASKAEEVDDLRKLRRSMPPRACRMSLLFFMVLRSEVPLRFVDGPWSPGDPDRFDVLQPRGCLGTTTGLAADNQLGTE